MAAVYVLYLVYISQTSQKLTRSQLRMPVITITVSTDIRHLPYWRASAPVGRLPGATPWCVDWTAPCTWTSWDEEPGSSAVSSPSSVSLIKVQCHKLIFLKIKNTAVHRMNTILWYKHFVTKKMVNKTLWHCNKRLQLNRVDLVLLVIIYCILN